MIVEPPDHLGALDDAGEQLQRYIVENMYFPDSASPDDPDDGDDDDDELTPEEVAAKSREEVAKWGGNVREQYSRHWSTKDKIIINIGAYLMGAATDFIIDCIQAGYFETETVVPEKNGWTYYNDVHLPTIPLREDLPYIVLYATDEWANYWITYSDAPLYYDSVDLIYRPTTNCHTRYGTVAASALENWVVGYNSWRVYTDMTWRPGAACSYVGPYIWSNYDIYDYDFNSVLVHSCSDSSLTGLEVLPVEPIAVPIDSLAGSIVAGGVASASDVPLPETVDFTQIFSGVNVGGLDSLHQNMVNSAQGLSNGSITINNYQQSITYVNPDSGEDDPEDASDPTVDTGGSDNENNGSDSGDSENEGSDTGDSEQQPAEGTFASYPVLDFFSRLGQLLQDIFDGNLLGVREFFEPFLSGIRDDLLDIDSSVQDGFDDVIQNEQEINDSIQDIYEQNQEQHNTISEWFQDLIDNITSIPDKILEGIENILLPSDDYLSDKVDNLTGNFAFADSIVKTGQALHVGLAGVTTEPPVIYIDLGAARGFHDIGGRVPFLDLRWYAEYKPTVDTIISAFLWICFVWRMLLKLPGIISGMPGDFVMTSAHTLGLSDMLPTRSKEYEIQRIDNRQSIWKGRGS